MFYLFRCMCVTVMIVTITEYNITMCYIQISIKRTGSFYTKITIYDIITAKLSNFDVDNINNTAQRCYACEHSSCTAQLTYNIQSTFNSITTCVNKCCSVVIAVIRSTCCIDIIVDIIPASACCVYAQIYTLEVNNILLA